MSLAFVLIALAISVGLLVFIVFQTIYNKRLFAMRDLGKFLPLAISFFCLAASVTFTEEITFAVVLDTIGSSFRAITMFNYNQAMVTATKDNVLLNVAFILTTSLQVYLFFSVMISLFLKFSANFLKKVKATLSKEHDVILDFNEKFLFNYSRTFKNLLIWTKVRKEEFRDMRTKLPINNAFFDRKSLMHYLRYCKNRVNFISISTDETLIMQRLAVFATAYNENPKLFKNTYFYISASDQSVDLYTEIVDASEFKSHIILYSRYNNFGNKFISEHPVSEFLTEEEIDYKTGCLKDDVSIDTFYIGFGKYNQEILLQELIHTNFFKVNSKTNTFEAYKVQNHLFDIEPIVVDTFSKSPVGLLMKQKEGEHYKIIKHDQIDINASSFFKDIDEIVDVSKETKNCYVFYVCCGNDATNIEIALDIKNRYLHKVHKMVIYCRVRTRLSIPLYDLDSPEVKEKYRGIHFIGHNSMIDNHQVIVNKSLESLAINKNAKYNQRMSGRDIASENLQSWLTLPSIKRYNNASVYLNLRFKLHLIGLDCCDHTDKGISKDEFIKHYLGGIDNYKEVFEQLLKYRYEDYYVLNPINNPRNLLAIAEHDRWNAYFLSNGYARMDFDKIQYLYDPNTNILTVIKDDPILKLHACLCSFEELNNYHQYNAKKIRELNKKIKEDNPDLNVDLTELSNYKSLIDTYYFDYDSFDEIYDVLSDNGYSIILKQ